MTAATEAWEARGRVRDLAGHRVFTVDVAAREEELADPLLVVHGFPTSSFDFHLVVDELARNRRVLLVDMVGYGLSEKPDRAYTVARGADVVAAFAADAGVARMALLTHDLGDTVGGELLARQLEGSWDAEITRRVLTNGSIYIAMAHLSDGQQLLLSLPDEKLPDTAPLDGASLDAALAGTFSPRSQVSAEELAGHSELIVRDGGNLLLPRLIRYIEERRRDESRFTGAIERHPSPLVAVWGSDDPIAVPDMVERLHAARPDLGVEYLDGVGHYPMIEAPQRFADAVLVALDG